MQKTRGSLRGKSKINYAEAEAFAQITDDEAPENNSDEERKQKQKNAVAAFDDTSELDDEVERVLSHRYASSVSFFHTTQLHMGPVTLRSTSESSMILGTQNSILD